MHESLGSYWDPGSVLPTASYLPKPGAQLYQFRYVNRQGRVCGQSPPFQFREPRPMDELVTLEETDGGSDILLVVPKATVLQVRTERQSCSQAREWEDSTARAPSRFTDPPTPPPALASAENLTGSYTQSCLQGASVECQQENVRQESKPPTGQRHSRFHKNFWSPPSPSSASCPRPWRKMQSVAGGHSREGTLRGRGG